MTRALFVCSLALFAGCQDPGNNGKSPGTPTGSPSTGTPAGTLPGTPVGTVSVTTPARGALIAGVDPAMYWTDCNLDPAYVPDPAGYFAAMGWEIRIGGQIDPLLQYYLGGTLVPAENYWGGAMRSALYYYQDLPIVAYAFETDASMELGALPVAIPYTDVFVEGGLARGYHGVIMPFLIYTELGGGGTWDSGGYNPPDNGYDPASRMTVSAEFGIDDNGTLTAVTMGPETYEPRLILRLGGSSWSGDEAQTDLYCEMIFYLDGVQQVAL